MRERCLEEGPVVDVVARKWPELLFVGLLWSDVPVFEYDEPHGQRVQH